MRILFLTNRPYLPQKVGGAESSTHEMIQALERRGHSCMVLSGFVATTNWLGLRNRVRRKILRHKAPTDYVMGYPVSRTWKISIALEKIKNSFQPDVAVLLPSNGGAYNLAKILHKENIPAVLHLRDVEFQSLGNPNQMHLAGFIANSKFTAQAFEQKYGTRPTVIYNVFDRAQYECSAIGTYVTFINPILLKGQAIALELARKNPDIPFLFVEGWQQKIEDKQSLLKKIEQLGNITWLDRLHDMRKVYSKTRILIVPSQWREAWGRVVSEAHMSGIPVLASNIGGLPESVGPGGQLLDPTDVEAWNSALRTMWNDPEVWSDYSTSAKNFSLRSDLRENDIAESYERALRSFSKMQRR